MDLPSLLKEAERVVEQSAVAPEFRAAAFGKVFDALAGRESPIVRDERDGAPSRLAAISARLELPLDAVERVFEDTGDDGGLSIAASQLEPTDAGATKQLALLVVGARQASGEDAGWTATAAIRDVCRDFGRLDDKNFATVLAGMDDVFSFRGKPRQRQVHMTRIGWERLQQLVQQLADA